MTVRAAGWTETRPAGKVLRLRIGRYMIQQVRLIDTIEAAPDSWRVKGGYPESRLVSVRARLVC
jgi:hypothetical protein